MKLLIVSAAPIIYKENSAYAYSPYVKELIVWEKYAKMSFCCPVWKTPNGLLVSEIPFVIQRHFKLYDSNLRSVAAILMAIFYSFYNVFELFRAMKQADHIHLRCPGNIGLLACFVQILFPNKTKTAKYAGNWDPQSKQPWSYKLQKYILSNTFLTRNMQVLVYGEWENQSKNIKPFFTATYSESEKENVLKGNLQTEIQFVFVGSLVAGKNPLYAIQLIEKLNSKRKNAILNIYGNGTEYNLLENYIKSNNLEKSIFLHGNQNQNIIKKAYQKSHFALLPSKSEGWPKAIAEAMFWGCVPIATKVSCVPFMLDFGNRGILLEMDLDKDASQIEKILEDEKTFSAKSELAKEWSQKYTTDVFETEIKKLLGK